MNEDIRTGVIDHIEIGDEQDVAWGTFDDAGTFDLPIEKHIHSIGDTVRTEVVESDQREEIGAEYLISIVGLRYATVYWCNFTPEGMEITHQEIFTKKLH